MSVTNKGLEIMELRFLKFAAIAAVPFVLSACSTSHQALNGMSSEQACAGNPFLQKYGCSISRVETAARSGDPDAQYALGYMYYYGIGTVRNPNVAEKWIGRAAQQGQPLARKAQNLLVQGGSMGPMNGGYAPRRRGSSPSLYQKKTDVTQLNNAAPAAPITNALPGYGNSNRQASQGSTPVLKNLKNTSKSRGNSGAPMQNAGPSSQATMNAFVESAQGDTVQSSSNTAPIQPQQQATPQSQVASAPSAISVGSSSLTSTERSLMKVASYNYTLQLMGSHKRSAVRSFIRRNKLSKQAKVYTTNYQGQKWFMVIYGQYPTLMQADTAAKSLPMALRNLHPWVKPFSIVKKEIRTREIVS